MPLAPGTKLGPYEIQSPLGAGGMGEVYLARDTRLERTVAVKILPDHLATSPEAQERFEREARSISSLSHPNICHLYDVGHEGSTRFLVMEYLQGESLAQRLAKGPLPLEQLLRVGAEIADGLERAHKSGVVHRDLKPGNIMLTKSGAKLLDFGLAKSAVTGVRAGPASGVTATYAPTAATKITQAGTVIGTFQYMAPEQIEGKEVDARSDIFAYGAVLYEMATGRCAFEGKSQISVASAILEREPEPITSILPAAPPALDHVIRGCLAKDPDARWQSAGDIARQLRWISSGGSQVALPATARTRRNLLHWLGWAFAAIMFAVVGFVQHNRTVPPIIRFSSPPPTDTNFFFDGDFGGPPVISPDGTQIVFAARSATAPSLYVQQLSSGTTTRLDGTDDASFPFWSPDGKFIAFFSNGKLERIPLSGGAVKVIADALTGRGGAWGKDNIIVFASDYRVALLKVDANGGTPVPATKLDTSLHSTHRWPNFLPDGKHFLFLATNHGSGTDEKNGIYLGQVGDTSSKFIVQSDAQAIFANGYLLHHIGGRLVAHRFDPGSGTLSGGPQTVAEGEDLDPGTWHSTFSASSNGILVYQGGSGRHGFNLVLTDRKGKLLKPVAENISFHGGEVSPDGKRLVMAEGDPRQEIWVYGLDNGSRTPLTFEDGANNNMPSWSPDGRRVVFQMASVGNVANSAVLRSVLANGGGDAQTVLSLKSADGSPSFSFWPQYTRDGKYLVFNQRDSGVFAVPVSGGRVVEDGKDPIAVLRLGKFGSANLPSTVSPDGKWIAYFENDSGREEVYITSFPSGQGRWQVSRNGGSFPQWRGDSKELYFLAPDFQINAVSVETNLSGVELGQPNALFRLSGVFTSGRPYTVTPDGKSFISRAVMETNGTSAPMSIYVNWPAALAK